MERDTDWSDLSEQQRSHLLTHLASELDYEQLRGARWVLDRLQQAANAQEALDYARAYALLRECGPPSAPR